MLLYSNNGQLFIKRLDNNKSTTLWNGSTSQTITHQTNVLGEIGDPQSGSTGKVPLLGCFCESNGKIYNGYEKITNTDCICQVQVAKSLNKKIVGIITSENQFASHGDVLVKVKDNTELRVGDILCPDSKC